MTNLDNILKSRDITLPTKLHLVKAVVFPGVMYGCERWTIKKTEHQRIDALELWCWRKLLRVPWTARTSNQSAVKEISPEYSLERLMLKLKLQSFGHLMQRTDLLDREAWRAAVYGVTKSWTHLSDWTELNQNIMAGFHTSRKHCYFCLPCILPGTYCCTIPVNKDQRLELVPLPSSTCRFLIIYTLTREGFKSCTRRKSD